MDEIEQQLRAWGDATMAEVRVSPEPAAVSPQELRRRGRTPLRLLWAAGLGTVSLCLILAVAALLGQGERTPIDASETADSSPVAKTTPTDRGGVSRLEPLVGVRVVMGLVVIEMACFDEVGGAAHLVESQIDTSDLWARGPAVGECLREVATGLDAGPDVVDAERQQRFSLINGSYREVDYCDSGAQRCSPVPPQPVPVDCSLVSLQDAAARQFGGIYPVTVLRCDGRWAAIDMGTCERAGAASSESCTDRPRRYYFVLEGGAWSLTSFDASMFCPDPSMRYGVDDIPEWVCEIE